MDKLTELSLFFPAYNEEENLDQTVEKAIPVLKKVADKFEILIINDGSKDKTGEVASKLAKKYKFIKVITHNPNRGYGAALKSGFYNSKYSWIVFTDADGQFDFSEVDNKSFIEQLQKISKNLSALNAVYELQLQGSSEQLEKTNLIPTSIDQFLKSLDSSTDFNKKLKENMVALNNAYEQQLDGTSGQVEKTKVLQEGMARFIDNLKVSAENTQNFQQELHSLTKNITALNNVYGNMLSAMNVNINK